MLLAAAALAQDPAAVHAASLDLQREEMGLLLGWSAGNLALGTVGALRAEAPRERAFWGGNAAWNTVNAGIAVASLARIPALRDADPADARRRSRALETGLLVNAGLDVVYVGSGLAMAGVGRRTGAAWGPTVRGLGEALVLQGAFLAVFDTTYWARQRAVSAPLR